MQTFLTIFIPIASGLAFITYKHPLVARQIINNSILILGVIYAILFAYYQGKRVVYNETSSIIIKTKPLTDTAKSLIDNLDYKIIQEDLKNNIDKNVVIESKISNDNADSYTVYYIIVVGVLAIFYSLSYTFEKLKKVDNNNPDNPAG